MKKLLLSIFTLTVLISFCHSNEVPLKKNYEIGVNLFNRNLNHNYQEPLYSSHFLNGFIVKKHFKHLIVRAAYNKVLNQYHFERTEDDFTHYKDGLHYNWGITYDKGVASNYDFRLGVEKRLHKGKFQTYLAVEIHSQFRRVSGFRKWNSEYAVDLRSMPFKYEEDYDDSYRFYGVSGALGFTYHITPNWSLAIETSVSNNQTFQRRFADMGFSPVRMLALNYCF